MKINITDADGDQDTIVATGDWAVEDVLRAHGYDPDTVAYSVKKRVKQRVEELEEATGVKDRGGKRGIAQRIDDLEDRVEALESNTSSQ